MMNNFQPLIHAKNTLQFDSSFWHCSIWHMTVFDVLDLSYDFLKFSVAI